MADCSPVVMISGGLADHICSCQWSCFGSLGGVSSGVYKSANIGLSVGDSLFAVQWNRDRIKEIVFAGSLLSARQVHGIEVFSLRQPLLEDMEVEHYDSLVTNQRGVGLMIQQADCQAVMLFDPVQKVIAAIHSGWRGSVQNIIEKTLLVMENDYSTSPRDVHAVISPSLGPCCAEFIHYKEEFPEDFQRYMVKENYFDFWKISEQQLADAGVLSSNINCAEVCTSCDTDYFSYRRACRLGNGVTGRNCSIIVLD